MTDTYVNPGTQAKQKRTGQAAKMDSTKQQALVNMLNKMTRQYFLFKEEYCGQDLIRVRLRDDTFRAEQVEQEYRTQRIRERLANNALGHMRPVGLPYEPAAGWPILKLEELVIGVNADRLDSKIWQTLRNQFEKTDIKRVIEKRTYKDILNDFSGLHECQSSGYNKIKEHVAESESRIGYVKAGYDYRHHFQRCLEERLKREFQPKETVQKSSADPDQILAMERQYRDMTMCLLYLKDFLEKLLLLRVRHLKSHTPIVLANLGTERDQTQHSTAQRPTVQTGGRSSPYAPKCFHLQPPQHNFKDQIVGERPQYWPVKVVESSPFRGSSRRNNGHLSGGNKLDVHLSIESLRPKKLQASGQASIRTNSSDSPSCGGSEIPSCEEGANYAALSSSARRVGASRRELMERFRKIWPPVWMSLASMEQGCYIVDPACPTKEFNQSLNTTLFKRGRKSFSHIVETRQDWADMRKKVAKNIGENLWREDKEKLEAYRVKYATLSQVPLSKPYVHHQRQMEEELKKARRERQKTQIYDCELTEWYKELTEKVHKEVGKENEEINDLLNSIKVHFKMSSTYPKLGKAKLALLTMSLPAYVACQVYVQRALTFILTKIMKAPAPLLTGWLASRGLPLVLVKDHAL